MRPARVTSLVLVVLSTSCGSAEPRARSVAPPSPPPAAPPSPGNAPAHAHAACPDLVDARALLARHAAAYGSPEAIAASLPVTQRGTTETEGKSGPTELVLTARGFRTATLVGGVFAAAGIDDRGPWSYRLNNGVALRLDHTPREGTGPSFERWLAARGYVAFDPDDDRASCSVHDGRPIVELAYARPELGNATVELDPSSAALIAATSVQAGKKTRLVFDAWTDRDARGVRWPTHTTTVDPLAKPVVTSLGPPVPGASCDRLSSDAPPNDTDCTGPPKETFSLTWPASGVVHVPISKVHQAYELLLRVKVGSREVWGVLDSGAGMSVIDALMPIAAGFTPKITLGGAGVTSTVRFGIGAYDRVEVGGLVANRLPVASVPVPALEAFGDRRPEIILGFPFFAAAVVRVDYKHSEVVFAKTPASVVPRGAVPIDVEMLGNAVWANAEVEGNVATIELDTGNSGGFELEEKWARARGIPGSRPTTAIRGKFGAGEGEGVETWLRLSHVAFGPVAATNVLSGMTPSPAGSTSHAGLLGNQIFARCASVTFDVAGRRVWIEPPCDRPVPEGKVGWRLAKGETVEGVVPGGSAERAGVRAGDRVLAIDGHAVKLGDDRVMTFGLAPAGTKVTLLVERGGEKKTIVMELSTILPPGR